MLAELKKTSKTKRSRNEKQLFENLLNQEPKRQKSSKKGKVNCLTIDEQITCFAEIIVNQLLNDLNIYEKD